jgi:hypothetical protein
MRPWLQAGLWCLGALAASVALLRIGWIVHGLMCVGIAALLVIVAFELRRE